MIETDRWLSVAELPTTLLRMHCDLLRGFVVLCTGDQIEQQLILLGIIIADRGKTLVGEIAGVSADAWDLFELFNKYTCSLDAALLLILFSKIHLQAHSWQAH